MTDELSFPDVSRSELDRTLSQLVENAQDVLNSQDRLRSLLKATRVVAGELELAEVLKRIIEAAVELVGARFGAIGVIAPDGTLEQFIHVGLPDELVGLMHLSRDMSDKSRARQIQESDDARKLMQNPIINELLNDEEFKKKTREGDVLELMKDERIMKALQDKDIVDILNRMGRDAAADNDEK